MSGYDRLCQSQHNKGLTVSSMTREMYDIDGLLPPAVLSNSLQMSRVLSQLRGKSTPLEKYIYLQSLQDTNEQLYYRLLVQHTMELMPLVYTPTVGQACIEFSHIYRQTPRGLYITILHKGKIAQILNQWPEKDIKAIVFTDGERILGLGDLGINGMGIPIGKLALYTACAGVHPNLCLPITLDVGTNNEECLADPYYMGLKQHRVRGEEYDAFIAEFMNAAKEKYGDDVLLQFEDFGNTNAFRLLRTFRDTHCTFNDDIQGTASVIVAGLLAAGKLVHTALEDHKFVFLGAGEAGTGIADLIALAIHDSCGKSVEEARKQIWLVDSKGLVVHERRESLQHHKLLYAHEGPVTSTCTSLTRVQSDSTALMDAINFIRPSVLIGVCTIPKSFTREVCETMAINNDRPIIFALSNPTSKAECTAQEAYTWTNGKCVFASGSPFPAVDLFGKTFVPGQGNNAYIFPGIGLGVLASGMTRITDDVMLLSAKTLAKLVTSEDLEIGCVYPPLSKIRQVSLEIAIAVSNYAYDTKLATKDRPKDMAAHVASLVYHP